MHRTRPVWLCIPYFALSCASPVRTQPTGSVSGVHGCWALSQPILRGTPLDSATPFPYSLVELAEAPLGRYGFLRVLGAPGLRGSENNPEFRIRGWQPIAPDSVEIIWSMRANAVEVRLRIRGDSAQGEYFYHGDILLAGQSVDDLRRPPVAVSAVRVRCPSSPAG